MSGAPQPDAFYYLRNFQQAIQWVIERNQGLLSEAERQFSTQLAALSSPAQALLARLLMRRGVLFRRSKIRYPEIESLEGALRELTAIGWLDAQPALSLADLFRLATKVELTQRLGDCVRRMTKLDAYESLIDEHSGAATFEHWLDTHEAVYHVTIAPVALQFRLLHFGNFYQHWHEYTLAHLQIFKYEPVSLDPSSRPFESRADIEFFYAMYECYEAYQEGAELSAVIALLPMAPPSRGWLRQRWDRLRYQLGQEAERQDQHETAFSMYGDNAHPEARIRQVRLLERLGRDDEALSAARVLLNECSSELVVQRVARIVARIEQRRGANSIKRGPATFPSIRLTLSYDAERRVEAVVQEHLSSTNAPVYYVENSLICSMFGLLCWEAIFAPVPGAFFHPFQSGPADLGCPEFVARRQSVFDACLQRLDNGEHAETILQTFAEKFGTSAPFVHWQALDAPSLQLALQCIPSDHLKLYFARLLDDLIENATGFPDLVQFFPASRTYKLIEVKGPGDRLQDNQRRWLQYGLRHQFPMEVCQVSWA